MLNQIDLLHAEIQQYAAQNPQEVEAFRLRFLSRNGLIAKLMDEFRSVPPDQKRTLGQRINQLKQCALDRYAQLEQAATRRAEDHSRIDPTRTAHTIPTGSRHVLASTLREIESIFQRVGFQIAYGPELEDDWHVFSALNFPPEHPARDMQDTFFIDAKKGILLRTHTSSVQVRVMEQQKPPIRVICPGRVFRNEDVSARAHCQFHQVEGLYVDRNVSFADLKQILLYFAQSMFGPQTQIRLRPSYFPFTEPSAEVDVSCDLCGAKGCNVCKGTGWLEILGCGMVDPNVLTACGIDPHTYSGYAFGMGVERIAMMRHKINDLRLFFENDIRFLSQF